MAFSTSALLRAALRGQTGFEQGRLRGQDVAAQREQERAEREAAVERRALEMALLNERLDETRYTKGRRPVTEAQDAEEHAARLRALRAQAAATAALAHERITPDPVRGVQVQGVDEQGRPITEIVDPTAIGTTRRRPPPRSATGSRPKTREQLIQEYYTKNLNKRTTGRFGSRPVYASPEEAYAAAVREVDVLQGKTGGDTPPPPPAPAPRSTPPAARAAADSAAPDFDAWRRDYEAKRRTP